MANAREVAKIMLKGPVVDTLDAGESRATFFIDEPRVVLLASEWMELKSAILAYTHGAAMALIVAEEATRG